ncbi:MAG: hypothetical protein OXG33_08175 [Chloroflexi bacterium]|nr:hypothetical protein [Chloroflexota bacterium]
MPEAFHERVYRWLLALYPREHRREYGELMVQLYRDRMRRDGKGFAGLSVWIHLIVDLCGSAAREHTEGVDMKSRTRFGIALAGVVVAGGIGAGVLLANSDGEPSVSLSWQETDVAANGEPEVSLSWLPTGDAGSSALIAGSGAEPRVSLSWQQTDAVAHGEPKISLSWEKADQIAPE